MGNAGEPEWVWEVMDLSEDDPRYGWFIQVTMYDNIRLSPEDREALEEAWGTDPETRQVELLGRRPLGLGNEIDPELLTSAVRDNLGGQVLQEHRAYGAVHYAKQPIPGHYYVIAGDPGKGRLPQRNSWCVMVLDITANPAEIVFFQMGNLGAKSKTYKPYLDAYKHAVKTYPVVSPADVIYDNGGQQSGMHEVILENLKRTLTAGRAQAASQWRSDLRQPAGLLELDEVHRGQLADRSLAQGRCSSCPSCAS